MVALAARGLTNRETGRVLWISSGTVRKHLDNVYDKLGVRSRAAVAAKLLGATCDRHRDALQRDGTVPAVTPLVRAGAARAASASRALPGREEALLARASYAVGNEGALERFLRLSRSRLEEASTNVSRGRAGRRRGPHRPARPSS